jgi:membrane protein involved in colicin uptake
MGFVIMNGDKGYSLQEMRRENFCAVRCIKNEAEAVAFEKSESEILVSRQKKEKLLAEEKARDVAEEKRLAEERGQKEADEKKKRDELVKRDAEAKKEAEDKLQKEQSKNKYILGGDSNNNTVNQNGQILVYISSDIGCGNIDVTVNGVTKKITNFHDTEPNCSSKGCAVFSLPPGEYNVKATCGKLSWDFSKTVKSEECIKTKLINNPK